MATEQGIDGPEPGERLPGIPPPLPDEVSTQDSGVRTKTNPVTWLRCLYFRPRKFFAECARSTSTSVVAICAYIFGAAWYLTYYMFPERRAEIPVEGSAVASYVFGYALIGAAVGGAFWYFVVGSWYSLRVLLCSPKGMSWKLSRRAFIFSELVYALPCTIGIAIWWIIRDRSFLLATSIVGGLLIFWSVYVSYRGVRTLFRAARIRALVFFVVLPGMLYAAGFAIPILINIYAKSGQSLKSRQTLSRRLDPPFDDAVFRMVRPANWKVAKAPRPGSVLFHIPGVGSFAASAIDSEGETIDFEDTVQAIGQEMAARFKTVAKELDTFPTWGGYSGHGKRILMNVDGKETIVRIFCGSLPDGRLLLTNEICLASAEARLQPQFEVVRKTLEVKPVK